MRPVTEQLADLGLDRDIWPPVQWLHDGFQVAETSFLVRGLLEPGSLIVLYGEAGTAKSTLAVNLAFAICRGEVWRDRPTSKGMVLHIAGEGARGLRLRQAAHVAHYDVPRTAPYAVLPAAVPFGPGTEGELTGLVMQTAADIGESPALVIVDTLARCLFGDENSGEDMGRFIACCDRIRTSTGAAVMVLHHSGKDSTKGARGHSSLRAAVDTELEVVGSINPRTLYVRKQRDLELADPMLFDLEPVQVGEADGQPVTACVVKHGESKPLTAKPTGRNQSAALTALREWTRANAANDVIASDVISDLLRTQGIDRRRRPEVLNYLVNARAITPSVGGYSIDRGML